jgi:hypothetical protein
MARIRRELHEDVAEVVDEASGVLDWRAHIRNHPWTATALAAGIGYFLIPRRATSVTKVVVAEPNRAMAAMGNHDQAVSTAQSSRISPWKIGWSLLSFAGPLALNAAQAYASSWIESFLVQQSRAPGTSGGGEPRPPYQPAPASTSAPDWNDRAASRFDGT